MQNTSDSIEVKAQAAKMRFTGRVKDPFAHDLIGPRPRVNIKVSVKLTCAFFLLVTFSVDPDETLSKTAFHHW